jgi:hypothetical protein
MEKLGVAMVAIFVENVLTKEPGEAKGRHVRLIFAIILVFFLVPWANRPVSGQEPGRLAAAYRAVLTRNLIHARRWLAEGDLKSLAQGAANMQLIGDLYAGLGDDPAWRATARQVRARIQELAAAAAAGDASRCAAAIQQVEEALSAGGAMRPQGSRQTLNNAPALRRLMLVLDSVQADAKVAVLTGQAAEAKNQAVLLSELGRLVSNARREETFVAQGRAFVQAAEALASVDENDLAAVRQGLRSLAQRCDACHEGQRP